MKHTRLTILPSVHEVTFGFCFLVFQIGLLGSLIAAAALQLGLPIDNLTINLIYFCIAAGAAFLILRNFHRANLARFRSNAKTVIKTALVALPLYYAVSIAVNSAISAAFPEFFNRNNDVLAGMLEQNFPLTLFMCAVLAPIVEETFHRGMIFAALSEHSRPLAYAISALCFCLIHLVGYLSAMSALEVLLSALQYIPAAVIFCYLYERTDCLWTPMLLHAGANLVSCIALRFTGG